MGRALPLIFLLAFGGCITLEEPHLSTKAIRPGQRTVVMIYPSPGPWVVSDTDSKAESAAKVLPGFSFVVQAVQDERDQKAAQDLRQYLPRFIPGDTLYPLLMKDLPGSGFPGKFVLPAEAEVSTETLRNYNRSADILSWQRTYWAEDPKELPRNYSVLLSLDDALVLEVNLLYGVAANDDGNMIPTLGAVSRLFRAETMKLLWRHEDSVSDAEGARSMYEFKTLPLQLIDRWKALMPGLSSKIAASLRTSFEAPPSPFSPPPSFEPPPPGFQPPPPPPAQGAPPFISPGGPPGAWNQPAAPDAPPKPPPQGFQ